MTENDWCMDTGASEYMCWDKSVFETFSEKHVRDNVIIGDGKTLKVHGVGNVVLFAKVGETLIKTSLSGVLFVPELKFNLFSVGSALDKGYKMVSDNEQCKFIDSTGNTRAVAKRENKLYKMCFVPNERVSVLGSNCHLTKKVEPISVWHCKLAHQNMKLVKLVLNRNNISYVDDSDNFMCEKCLSGKQHRKPFPTSDFRATNRLELVHADVCGPMEEPSIGGARYFLLLKDDYSSYKFVFFLKHKSEVKEHIEKFIKLSESDTAC